VWCKGVVGTSVSSDVLAAAMQRRFVHVKIEQSGSAALLPTILIFQSEDVALLNAEFNKTLEVRVSDL
jgi:hypothetical protein